MNKEQLLTAASATLTFEYRYKPRLAAHCQNLLVVAIQASAPAVEPALPMRIVEAALAALMATVVPVPLVPLVNVQVSRYAVKSSQIHWLRCLSRSSGLSTLCCPIVYPLKVLHHVSLSRGMAPEDSRREVV